MAKYTIISDIGKGLIALLRDKLVPDPIDKAESIGICDPKTRGDYVVGIHPYDIREDNSGTVNTEGQTLPDGSKQDPPAMMELYYVISVSSKAGLESKALDEAKIVGKIIQVLKDNPIIPSRYMPNDMGAPIENVPISMLPLSMEEKVKVWTMFGESYKLSMFYVIGPVAIDSENIHKPKKRVETVFLGSEHYEYQKRLQFATHIKEEDIDDEWTQRPDEDEDEAEEEDTMEEENEDNEDEIEEDVDNELGEEESEEYEDEGNDETDSVDEADIEGLDDGDSLDDGNSLDDGESLDDEG